MRRIGSILMAFAALVPAGCGTIHGPGIEYVAPKVTGRAVEDVSGRPVPYARVGRKLWTWRQSTGGTVKGGEELVRWQDDTRTDRDGRFRLPAKRVALLFSFGDVGLNMGLAVQHGGYVAWRTNYPISALSTNAVRPEIEAGEIRLRRK